MRHADAVRIVLFFDLTRTLSVGAFAVNELDATADDAGEHLGRGSVAHDGLDRLFRVVTELGEHG